MAWLASCTGRPAAPFELRLATAGTLDKVSPEVPARSWASIAQSWVFEPLARLGPDGVMVPMLASRLELVTPRSLRVWLRADPRFSDGSAVTFEDVASSLASHQLRVRRDGDALLVEADGTSVLPIDLLLTHAFVFRRTEAGVVGSGPFAASRQGPSEIILDRVRQRPGFIQRVRILGYAKPADAFAHTLKGDADLLPEVDDRWLEFFEGVPRLRISREPGAHANAIAFNLKRLPREERMALVSALRSDALRKLAFGDDCQPPPRRPEIEPLSAGRSLDVLAYPILERFALAVRRELGARGGRVDIRDLRSIFSTVQNGDFDLLTVKPLTWPPVEAVSSLRTGAPTNLLGYSNPAVDAAIDRRDWPAAQRAIDADPPVAIVCTPPYVIVVDSRIRAASFNLDYLPDWEVAP